MKSINNLLVCLFLIGIHFNCQPIGANDSGSPETTPRPPRDPLKTLAEAIETMQRLARVTTAISLQQSIVNDSFSSDDVFSDLLRMGPLRPSHINSIDVVVVEKAFDAIKAVQLEDAADVEKFYGAIDKISREVDDVGQLKDWNPDVFREAIKGIDLRIHSYSNMKIVPIASEWLSTFNQLGYEDNALNDLHTKSVELRKTIQRDLSEMPFFHFNKIQSARSGFSLVRKTLKGMDVYKRNKRTILDVIDSDGKFATNSGNFKAVQSIARSIPAGLSDLLKNILAFYKNQKSRGSQLLKKTSAFPNGLEDLKSIDEDIGHLKKIVSSGNKLKKALEPLKDLQSLQQVSNTLKTPDDQKIERLAEVIEVLDTISNAAKSISSAETVRKVVKTFREKEHPQTAENVMKTISTEVEKVDASLIGLDVFVVDTVKNLTMLDAETVLQKLIDSPKAFKSADELQEAVEKMKNNANALAVQKHLKQIVDQFGGRETPIKNGKDNILSKLQSFDIFKTETAGYVKLFETLRAHSEQVMRMLRTIEKLRSSDRISMLADVIEILKFVKSTSEDFERLKSTIADKKSSPSRETTALSTQTSLKTPSEVIGTATRGIVMMKSVLEKPPVFDSEKWFYAVWREEKKVVVPIDPDTPKRLRLGILSTIWNLPEMNEEMANWNRSLQYFTQPLYIVGFAQKVRGVHKYDFSEMSNAVEALQKAILAPTSSLNRKRAVGQQDILDDLKAELNMLASFNLDIRGTYGDAFLRFENALNEVNMFFSRFTRTIKPRKTFNPKRRQSERPRKSWKAAKFVKKDRHTEGIIFTVSYVTTGFVIVAALTSLILYCEQRDGGDDDDDIEGKWTEDEHSSDEEDEEEKTTPSGETGDDDDDDADEEDVEMSQSEEVEEETIDVFEPDVMEEGLRHRNKSSKSSKTLKSTKTTSTTMSTTISTTLTDSTEVDGSNIFRSVAD